MAIRCLLPAALFVPAALANAGCADVYKPRANSAVTVLADGSGGLALAKNGKFENVGVGMGALEDDVRGVPRAEEEAATASSQSVGSAATGLLGAVALGVGAGMLAADAGNTAQHGSNFPSKVGDAAIGMLVGSIALNIASAVLRANAQTHFYNAVNIYNDEMAARAAPLPYYPAPYVIPGGGPGLVPAPGYPMPAPQWGPPAQPGPAYPVQPQGPNYPAQPPSPLRPPPGLPPIQPLPPGALPPAGTQPIPQ